MPAFQLLDDDPARYPNSGLSAEAMNEAFLEGKRLALDLLESITLNSAHIEAPLIWRDPDGRLSLGE